MKSTSLKSKDILSLLPNKYPFIMIDHVNKILPGKSAQGYKTITTNDSIKIYGNPNLKVDKKIVIKDYLKDHRVFMTSVIAALSFGGKWRIANPESIKTSFPSFLKIINELKK